MMEIMDHDRFKRLSECEQGLKWSTIAMQDPGAGKTGQSYSFTHQGTFRLFGQCIQLGLRTKTSFKTASKLFNQQL